MSPQEESSTKSGGAIAYMATNGVAANLLRPGILAAGLVSFGGLEREAWPIVPFNTIEVSVAYPGASPEEVEESIVVKIEEQVEALEDVKTVKSVAAPGIASVRVELKTGTDIGAAMDEVESAVGLIQSFPGGAERSGPREMDNRTSMIRLTIFGNIPESLYQREMSLKGGVVSQRETGLSGALRGQQDQQTMIWQLDLAAPSCVERVPESGQALQAVGSPSGRSQEGPTHSATDNAPLQPTERDGGGTYPSGLCLILMTRR